MSEKDLYIVHPDPENVKKLMHSIDDLLCSSDVLVIDAMTALIAILISRSQSAGFPKGTLLGYISNSWELNDPENDHPDRADCQTIEY